MAKRNAKKAGSATPKSTASIFTNPEELERLEAEEARLKEAKSSKPASAPVAPVEPEDPDDPMNAQFPLNYVYLFIDILNETMTLLRFIQLMCWGYIAELVYFNMDKFTWLTPENWLLFGFNLLGVVVSVALAFAKGDKTVALLPEFNHIYLALVPMLYLVIHFDRDLVLCNASLNYFVLDKMHPILSGFSSIVFYQTFTEAEDIMRFVQFMAFFYFCTYALNSGGDETACRAETHLLAVLLTNLVFDHSIVFAHLSLTIAQKLLLSFFVATLLASQVFDFLPQLAGVGLWIAVFYGLTVYQLTAVLESHPLVWLYHYIHDDADRLSLTIVWAGALAVLVPAVFLLAPRLSLNIRRKIWHFAIVIMMTWTRSILTTQIDFTVLALLGTILVFGIIELARSQKIWLVGPWLQQVLLPFQDAKDQGHLNLLYVYLLIGVSWPIVYDYILFGTTASLNRYLGLISLGLGDAMALIIGRRFGTFKWKGSNKSIQGSTAFVVTVVACCVAVDYSMSSTRPGNYIPVKNWENVVVATVITAVLEGTSNMNDNLMVPLVLTGLLLVLDACYPEAMLLAIFK